LRRFFASRLTVLRNGEAIGLPQSEAHQ